MLDPSQDRCMRQRMPRSAIMITRCLKLSLKLAYLSFAKNASAGIALRCRAFVTVMQAADVPDCLKHIILFNARHETNPLLE